MNEVKTAILRALRGGPLSREQLRAAIGKAPDVHPGQLRRAGLIDGMGTDGEPFELTAAEQERAGGARSQAQDQGPALEEALDALADLVHHLEILEPMEGVCDDGGLSCVREGARVLAEAGRVEILERDAGRIVSWIWSGRRI